MPNVPHHMIPTSTRPAGGWFSRGCLVAWLLALLLGVGAEASAQNLLQNPGFETGNTTGWFSYGPATLSPQSVQVRSGNHAVLVQNRTNTWHGIAQSVQGVLAPGNTYRLEAWVRLTAGGPQPVQLTIQQTDDAGTAYFAAASGTATATNWTRLVGGFTLNVSGTLTALNLYVEGPAAGVDFYADDFLAEFYEWRAQADARIEQFRKREVRLSVVDTVGAPVPGVTVVARQTRHHFAFGSAINYNISNPAYRAFFRTNFQWAVMENESKWYANEPSRSNVTYTAANAITNYCHTNGIILRGHTLFWAVEENVQTWVKNLDNHNLRVHLTNRLNSAVNHFKGTFVHWDVNNEMLHGDYFGIRLGAWVNPWMFQHARALDPQAKLFVNDYNIIAGNRTEDYKQQILALIASNAPVDAIGVQGHFGATVDPLSVELRFDSLSELGLPIWVTEYDSLNPDAVIRGDNLEKLYRVAFSKPAVEGVLMWGFWAGSHWRGSNAAIVDLDWTLNAAGERYQSLLTGWTTVTNGLTDAAGDMEFRGFHGDYDAVVTVPGGQPTLRRFTLLPGAGTNVVTLIAHAGGSRPLLHSLALTAGGAALAGQLTGDAGRAYAIESAASLQAVSWTTLTNVFNPTGTVGFTVPVSLANPARFQRARQLPAAP